MVDPDLDKPGSTASAWAMPIRKAPRKDISLFPFPYKVTYGQKQGRDK
ncbi:MAG: hypothetical protein MZV63_21985 [Marinilabiliales bacterium]|nr:hypothetical protein [Marinilabiliales bacterium]